MRALLATGGVILGMALLSGLLGGCASPATPAGIVPTTFDVTARHAASVSDALTGAIERSGVFSSVADGSRADYRLAVQIFRVQPPLMGFAMRANMEAGWTLLKTATNKMLWQQSIASDFTATTSDAFVGATRSRMAVEGAARENIKQGIAALSRLPLEQDAK